MNYETIAAAGGNDPTYVESVMKSLCKQHGLTLESLEQELIKRSPDGSIESLVFKVGGMDYLPLIMIGFNSSPGCSYQ